jgi:hypothetical protein
MAGISFFAADLGMVFMVKGAGANASLSCRLSTAYAELFEFQS